MKHADIQRLHEAGFITDDQRRQILQHYRLREDTHRFRMVLSIFGGLLVALGIVLLIASNWDEIPRFAKLATGLLLLVGAHAGGWWVAHRRGGETHPVTAEGLHLAGAVLFLANIGLVGQIYHLSSRLPDAWLLWWAGIAALPWILRSRALHLLSLIAFGIWFGSEIWSDEGWFRFGSEAWPLLLIILLGLSFYGAGLLLRRTSWTLFAEDTEKFGLLAASAFSVPLVFHDFQREALNRFGQGTTIPFWTMAALAAGLILAGLLRERRLADPWRLIWGSTLGAVIALLVAIVALGPAGIDWLDRADRARIVASAASLILFGFGLIQVRVGVQLATGWLVNLGVTLIAVVIFGTFLSLIGSMARTGLMFVVSGALLIALGWFLETRRRALLRQMHSPASIPNPVHP